jgi:hypothetical protein
MNTPTIDPSPWYHHFWPWFIVLLLGISVIASLYTVSLAYQLGDIESPVDPPRAERESPPAREAGGRPPNPGS